MKVFTKINKNNVKRLLSKGKIKFSNLFIG